MTSPNREAIIIMGLGGGLSTIKAAISNISVKATSSYVCSIYLGSRISATRKSVMIVCHDTTCKNVLKGTDWTVCENTLISGVVTCCIDELALVI